ncbi:carboxymuconolactone decarboxylase family protein [Novosphingobium sp.]|uniref:carboxymuconolactone decarboxylase family protein n=1 Tax=Novosphingobium sp. TaxID=1874826 RepID=UPI00286E7D69|nr:carboxymuconolactone decarboxylase family protein [Novosphingobium sp.]
MSHPRIPPLPQAEWTDEAREVFAYWEGEQARQNGSRSNTMMTLAQHPNLALASLDLGKYFMLESALSARQIKLIILRIAHRYGSVYQWTHNAHGALQVGISDDEIDAIRSDTDVPIWSAEDRALLNAVDATCSGGRFDGETWEALTTLFDRRFIMDLIHAAGYFTMVAWGLIAMGVEVEPDFADFSKNRAKPK